MGELRWTFAGKIGYHEIRMQYPDYNAYRHRIAEDAFLPEGFQTAAVPLEFIPREIPDAGKQSMNLALIRLRESTSSFAGVFTRNAFPGWPVILGRKLMDASKIQGILVNNKVANVGAEGGLEASERLSTLTSALFGDPAPYIPSSTGVIGWSLPMEAMEAALPGLKDNLQTDSLLPFAEAIMTTDAWPKLRSSVCGDGRITATAKGAGMVEPDMATMLAFFLTDVAVPRDVGRKVLSEVAEETFNRISIDGDTSTSDSVFLLSSGVKPYPGDDMFHRSLMETAAKLSEDVVRNGEGTAHVFRVTVSGVEDRQTAVFLARSIVNAPLTKTAVRGNDPNVGRILQALGAACGRAGVELLRDRLSLDIGGRRVFEKGAFHLNSREEAALSAYFREKELPLPSKTWPLHEERVEIELQLGLGNASASVTASDLSEEYVKINADYRT